MVNFVRMQNLDDLKEILWADGPAAQMIAGGTDLLVRQRSLTDLKMLVDISRIPELGGVDWDANGQIRVGAGATHQEICDHPLVQRQGRVLAQACGAVGSLQIRNRGTLGGNLANASPAGDSLPALVCLDAEVCLVSRDRERRVGIRSFFSGPGQTVREPDEIIESVRFGARRGHTLSFFRKAGQRLGMCCSKASVACVARRHGDGRLSQVRVALGAVAPTVLEVPAAAAILEGRKLSEALIHEAAQACRAAARPIDDIRSTADYRRVVVAALLTEGLLEGFDHMRELARRRKARHRKRSQTRRR